MIKCPQNTCTKTSFFLENLSPGHQRLLKSKQKKHSVKKHYNKKLWTHIKDVSPKEYSSKYNSSYQRNKRKEIKDKKKAAYERVKKHRQTEIHVVVGTA